MRQRDANLTALAAIGPRKKRKLDSPGGTAAGAEVRTCPPGGACPRRRDGRPGFGLFDFIFFGGGGNAS